MTRPSFAPVSWLWPYTACLAVLICGLIAAEPAEAAERRFSIFSFETIRVQGGVDVEIVTGKAPSAEAEGDNQNVLDRVILRNSGKELVVGLQRPPGGDTFGRNQQKATLRLTTRELDGIIFTGSGRVTIDKLSGQSTSIRLGGFGSLNIRDVESDDLRVKMSGAGAIEIAGEAQKSRIEIIGSGSLNGPALKVKSLNLIHRGPGTSRVFASKDVEIDNSGSGSITVDGRHNCIVRSTGSAQIDCDF